MSDGPQVGYRFYPTEEELINYLLAKIQGTRFKIDLNSLIPVAHIYAFDPSELPQYAGEFCRGDKQEEWYFFIPKQDKEARGGRPNRQTDSGYWKCTGSPGKVYSLSNGAAIGTKKTMVFYHGRYPGSKTEWKMTEYKALDHNNHQAEHEYSVCRVYTKKKCVRPFDRRPSLGRQVVQAAPCGAYDPSMSIDHHGANPAMITESTSSEERVVDGGDHPHQALSYARDTMLEEGLSFWEQDNYESLFNILYM
ncbi:NAC domain-containing protein [Drosera capensis]